MMRWIKYTLCGAAFVATALCAVLNPVDARTKAASVYEPAPTFCYLGNAHSALCSRIPADINPDPALSGGSVGYPGIFAAQNSVKADVQSPLDNTSWQTFVALNWAAGKTNQAAKAGLNGHGPRVWEAWPRVSALFHDAPSLAHCQVPAGMPVFQIGATAGGQPDAHNEEYIQAATDFPLIDVAGNWTIYERRLNGREAAYLKAPDGSTAHTLTTLQGQAALVAANPGKEQSLINFPAYTGSPVKAIVPLNGAIEVKAAWRILNLKAHPQDAKRFYIVHAMLTVSPKLVQGAPGTTPGPICAQVDLGLAGMHIIQKNLTHGPLKPSWIWSSFEQADNAPMADQPCDVKNAGGCRYISQTINDACPPPKVIPAAHYSYFNMDCPDCTTNQAPVNPAGPNAAYTWSPRQPYAGPYMTTGGPKHSRIGTQVTRCFATYPYTDHLNKLWRAKLAAAGSVFQHYMLVGTQWAPGSDNFNPKTPSDGTLPYLSNTTIETFMQTQYSAQPFGTGSCISCHALATLPNQAPAVCNVASNFSFLPSEATAVLTRATLGVHAAGDKCPSPPAAKSP